MSNDRTQIGAGSAPRASGDLDDVSTQFLRDPADRPVGRLLVVSGPGEGQARPVFTGTNAVGRSADNRVPLDFGDTQISRQQHAVMVFEGRTARLVDGGKANPVTLNGAVVTGEAPLKTGDVIGLGETTLRLELMG